MSPLLREFLQSWIDWVDSGAPDGKPYLHCDGLCLAQQDFEPRDEDEDKDKLERELSSVLWKAFKTDGYPFDNISPRLSNDAHLNPKRLAWVRKVLAERMQP